MRFVFDKKKDNIILKEIGVINPVPEVILPKKVAMKLHRNLSDVIYESDVHELEQKIRKQEN